VENEQHRVIQERDKKEIIQLGERITQLKEDNEKLKILNTEFRCRADIYAKDHELIINLAQQPNDENKQLSCPNKISNYNHPLLLNNIAITVRPEDGYVNLTALCKAGNKEYSKWKENKQTEAFLQALSSSLQIRRDELIGYETGSIKQRATWGHPQVAINIAQWISPEFDVQVSKWIFELMLTGRVELGKEKSSTELDIIYNKQIDNAINSKKDTHLFDMTVSKCPVEFYNKEVVYLLKFKVPEHLHAKYVAEYPNIASDEFICVKFGISNDLQTRIVQHQNDKANDEVILLDAYTFKNRIISRRMEKHLKTVAKQMNIDFKYEKKVECMIVSRDTLDEVLENFKDGIEKLECDVPKPDLTLELKQIELNHELEKTKLRYAQALELFSNGHITFQQYSEITS
jgi:predicted GIY-YIG superfamily endonuclease